MTYRNRQSANNPDRPFASLGLDHRSGDLPGSVAPRSSVDGNSAALAWRMAACWALSARC